MKRSTKEAWRVRKSMPSVALTAVVAVGVTAALALFADAPWATMRPQPQRPVPAQWPVMVTPVSIANEVDWSLVEVSENPGPLAIAAYGP